MAQPYIGEIRMFAGNFAPLGWEFCEGQQLDISQNEALFQLIGTTYGGDGQQTFALPDLRGRVAVHHGSYDPSRPTYQLSETGGAQEVTLAPDKVPAHTHPLVAAAAPGTANSPQNAVPAGSPAIDLYRETSASSPLAAMTVGAAGGSQPHTNVQPSLCINHIISMFGIFPSPT